MGDRIVSINSQSLDGLSHAEVVNMLKNAYGDIVLQVHMQSGCVLYPITSRSIRSTMITNGSLLHQVTLMSPNVFGR